MVVLEFCVFFAAVVGFVVGDWKRQARVRNDPQDREPKNTPKCLAASTKSRHF